MPATSLKSVITQLNETFNAAFNRGDGATLAALYVPNAVLLPPGAQVQKGRAAIRSFWEGMMREYGELKLVTVDLKRFLEGEIGKSRTARYWELFEQLRHELGYADYLGALQR